MADEHKHEHKGTHEHGHDHNDHDHSHSHEDAHAHGGAHVHEDTHAHDHEHGHSHDHGDDHKSRFHDPAHAAEFDQRGMSDMRSHLTTKLIEALTLKGDELILDLATGTGRVARPLAQQIKNGRIVGVDEAMAMLDVGHQHKEPIAHYVQSAGEADKLPFKSGTFDRAFVSFSLHHFGNPAGVVSEVLRVLKNGGRFVVLDPIIEEAKDSVDIALEAKINQVFRRTHGGGFRFHTASSIQRLLTKAGYRVPRTSVLSYPFNQEGMDGLPTGRHWLEAALELEKEAPELAERMKKNYFTWHSHGDHAHVKGSFSYALITGVKPA
ncbi:MAG: Methyltransferase protein [Deltaproteobacteria bacterium]|nr:Methyltransferase protein [Deltaproteobacteria bacterium]